MPNFCLYRTCIDEVQLLLYIIALNSLYACFEFIKDLQNKILLLALATKLLFPKACKRVPRNLYVCCEGVYLETCRTD